MKALGEEAGEFSAVQREVVQDLLNCGAKLGKGDVVAVARGLVFEELPEALDQVQVRRVGRQI
jgi:hypothetical protein